MTKISLNTEATLLLCGHFHAQKQSKLKPLTPTEYNKLAQWLHKTDKRPSDLVASKPEEFERNFLNNIIDIHRLKGLVARGAALALAIEAWQKVGLWIVGRSESDYPKILKQRFGNKTPALLYGVGNIKLLGKGGVCIVGSRNVSVEGKAFAEEAAKKTAFSGLSVVSGGARGVDKIAMQEALEAEGTVIGVLADSLLKAAVAKQNRQALSRGDMALVSPFGADTGFTPGIAMGRNRYLYAFSDLAIIVDSDTTGGTWNGAQENHRHKWVSSFVRSAEKMPKGNGLLIEEGLTPLTLEKLRTTEDIRSLLSTPQQIDSPHNLFIEHLPVDTNADQSLIPEQLEPEILSQSLVPTALPTFSTSVDYFELFMAKCHAELESKEHLKEQEIADAYKLERAQVKSWLARAEEEGKLTKLSNPVRYFKPVNEDEVIRKIVDVLEQPLSEKQLIEKLNVPRVVLRPLIQMALEKNQIAKKTKPSRYVRSEQNLLFR